MAHIPFENFDVLPAARCGWIWRDCVPVHDFLAEPELVIRASTAAPGQAAPRRRAARPGAVPA